MILRSEVLKADQVVYLFLTETDGKKIKDEY